MIYVRVPKDIKEYKGRWALGLTRRQWMYLLIGAVCGLIVSFFLFPLIGSFGVGIVIVIFIMPAVVIGFSERDGIPMQTYLKYMIFYYTRTQKMSYRNQLIDLTEKKGVKVNDQTIKEKIIAARNKRRIAKAQAEIQEDGTTKKKKRKTKHAESDSLH